MKVFDINALNTTDSVLSSDFIHIFRLNDYSMLLSYKEKINNITNKYQDISIIKSLQNELSTLMTQLNSLSNTLLTQSFATLNYSSLESLDAQKNQLLSKNLMDELMSKYINETDMENKAYQIKTEAQKLADEITDYVGAAMVGINQSNASYSSSSSTE